MLSQILDLVKGVSDKQDSEPQTVLEQLEQENSQNVTERHLLVAEKEYEDSGNLAKYGIQISAGGVVNSFITYGILHSINAVSLSFNPMTFLLLTTGINTMTSVMSADKNASPKVNLLLGSAKFVVNMSVNGSLIGQINNKTNDSRVVVESIRREIENYENGYQEQTTDYGLIAMIITAFITAIFIIPKIVRK